MTRDEWIRSVMRAYSDETCLRCGRHVEATYVTEDGEVRGFCGWCNSFCHVGDERLPPSFTPEPDEGEDLPF